MYGERVARIIAVALLAAMLVGCEGSAEASPNVRVVTAYVQNETPDDVWVAPWPLTDGALAAAYPRGIGVRCYTVAAGSQVVLLDGPPGDGDPAVARVIAQTHGERRDSHVVWVALAAGDDVTNGDGVPAWWSDAPHDCTTPIG